MKRFAPFVLALLLTFVSTLSARAMFREPQATPIARVVKTLNDYLKDHPDSHKAHYKLGRACYLAYALKTENIATLSDKSGGLEIYADIFEAGRPTISAQTQPSTQPMTKSDEENFLNKGIEEMGIAVKMDKDNGLYHLGLGCALEDRSILLAQSKDAKTKDQSGPILEQAIAEYRRAYDLSIKSATDLKSNPVAGIRSLVGYEAGRNYVRTLTARGLKPGEINLLPEITENLKTVENLRNGPITPIIFSINTREPLNNLIDKSKIASFDLDGTGRPQRYEWVKPTTAILVWDPASNGKITSGRQLFGNVTWWLFWNDGYEALATLDDNRDGRLEGPELKGMAIWIDANANGVADPGEVTPIEKTSIQWINVRPSSSMKADQGIGFVDGRVLPTYDWVAKSAK